MPKLKDKLVCYVYVGVCMNELVICISMCNNELKSVSELVHDINVSI